MCRTGQNPIFAGAPRAELPSSLLPLTSSWLVGNQPKSGPRSMHGGRVLRNDPTPFTASEGAMLRSAAANMLSRVGRAPAFRPRARAMSGMPGKEQMNAAAARAGDEAANLGASIGENVQKLQWWTSAKVRRRCPKHCVVACGGLIGLRWWDVVACGERLCRTAAVPRDALRV